jgi:hypothetical protein
MTITWLRVENFELSKYKYFKGPLNCTIEIYMKGPVHHCLVVKEKYLEGGLLKKI